MIATHGFTSIPPGRGDPRDIAALLQSGPTITALTADSRHVAPGMTFAAYPGDAADGRQFIPQAILAGASSVLWECDDFEWPEQWTVPNVAVKGLRSRISEIANVVYGHPSEKLWMVGVTGTNGKTSCSHYLAQLLNRSGNPCAVVGTLGNGMLSALEPTLNTTPDAIALQQSLQRFCGLGAEACALEVSSHGLVQNRVTGVSFKGAIFTNLSRDHLDYHGNLEAYGAAKELLFHAAGLQFAVINLDDAFGFALAGRLVGTVPRVIGTTLNRGLTPPAGIEWVCAENVVASARGLQFDVTGCFGRAHASTALLGRFNAANLLQVMAAAVMSGLSLEEVCAGLATLQAPQGRLERLGGPGVPTIVIDYAHTPDALDKALTTLRDTMTTEQKLICVMGCGGDRDVGKRPLMGAVAARLADHVVLTSDNPRFESVDAILDGIAAGMTGSYQRIADRAQAIDYAITHAAPTDVVLIAGKGHEQYQDIAGQKIEFSDRTVAEACLAGGRP